MMPTTESKVQKSQLARQTNKRASEFLDGLASTYRRVEDVIVESIVIPELKLGDVQRQIFGADFAERANHAICQVPHNRRYVAALAWCPESSARLRPCDMVACYRDVTVGLCSFKDCMLLCNVGVWSLDYTSTFNAAINASCGISTLPNWRMRFLPSFCLSRSLRLRDTSPP